VRAPARARHRCACRRTGESRHGPAAPQPAASAAPAFDPATADARRSPRRTDEAQRFDAFLTYEVTRAPTPRPTATPPEQPAPAPEIPEERALPLSALKGWAALVRQTRGGSDDLFFYVDRTGASTDRRIRRIPSPMLERHAFFDMLAIGDYRPTSRGELHYADGPDELQGEVPCRVVVATTPAPYLGFDRLELVFTKASGLLLEERCYFLGAHVIRRLTSKPEDFRDVDGRRLAFHRTARTWPDDGPTGDQAGRRARDPGPARQPVQRPEPARAALPEVLSRVG
jgi:hypothetical protein